MKNNTLTNKAFYEPTLPRDEVAKVLGLNFDDFKNRPLPNSNKSDVDFINLNNIHDEKIREKIIKLYKKDRELQLKQSIKNFKSIPVIDYNKVEYFAEIGSLASIV